MLQTLLIEETQSGHDKVSIHLHRIVFKIYSKFIVDNSPNFILFSYQLSKVHTVVIVIFMLFFH